MLYQFQIELSDIDRGVYESLDFRVAQHPSENLPYLLSRTLAYALMYQEGIEFAPGGLSDPEAPALQVLSPHGTLDLWIEIGNPSARKLHKASKAARKVVIFTYKKPDLLVEEIKSNNVHRMDEIEIFAFDTKFLQSLEAHLEKKTSWSLLHQQGRLDIETGKQSISTELIRISLND